MTASQWVTLVIAILGVLHGPIVAGLIKRHGQHGNGQ